MLLRCIKINKFKRVIVSALVAIIVIGSITGAVFTAPVTVYALSAGGIKTTIASIIMSLILQTGAAPVNQTWVSGLNSAYGYTIETAISEGLLTESAGGLIDTGLSSSIASSAEYTSLGLSDIFTTTAADGASVIPASGAVNIANTAIHVGKAGTIGAFAGAVAVGIGVGVLINHVRDRLGRWIKAGFPMDYTLNETEPSSGTIKAGMFYKQFDVNYRTCQIAGDENTVVLPWINNRNDFGLLVFNKNSNTGHYSIWTSTSNVWRDYNYDGFHNEKSNKNNNRDKLDYINVNVVGSYNDAVNLMNSIKQSGEVPDNLAIHSPDIIGPEGNQTYNNVNDNFPGLVNQIPEGSDMTPVNMEDYQTYVDNANDNTNNGETGQPVQGEAFDDLIDSLIVAAPTIPDQPIIPENPDDVPTVPDRPIVPEQPTIPDKPSVTQEDIEQALQGATTIDLRSIFPFCIPFDLYNLLLIFDTGENRKAPHISFTFPFTDWVIDVDLAVFDPVAGILRLLELILFIIGLAVATRALIGAGGSG